MESKLGASVESDIRFLIALLAIAALLVIIGLPVVRLTQFVTNIGFRWILWWIGLGVSLFLIWAGRELLRTYDLNCRIWSSKPIVVTTKFLWTLTICCFLALFVFWTRHNPYFIGTIVAFFISLWLLQYEWDIVIEHSRQRNLRLDLLLEKIANGQQARKQSDEPLPDDVRHELQEMIKKINEEKDERLRDELRRKGREKLKKLQAEERSSEWWYVLAKDQESTVAKDQESTVIKHVMLWILGIIGSSVATILSVLNAHWVSVSAGMLVAVCIFIALLLWKALNEPIRGLVPRLATVLVMSLSFSWILISFVNHYVLAHVNATIPSREKRMKVLHDRESDLAKWNQRNSTNSGEPPVVAITLSGGGYRAALTHAGLLWALGQARVQLQLMSTVSGGSIVGAAYASGWTPQLFRDYLIQTRPGLPRDLLDFFNVVRRIEYPMGGSGETFAAHLSRNFYSTLTIDEIGPPILIINATELDTGQRAAFWPQAAPDADVSRLIAASGAFPGAFDPVYLGRHQYIDGGIVENLGVEGLHKYLDKNIAARTPSVLIISDLSAEPPSAVGGSTSLVAAVLRADSLVYQQLHAHIFDNYTLGAYQKETPSLQGYSVPAATIWPNRSGRVRVFILRPTSKGEIARLSSAEQVIADSVAKIGTLLEPSPEQVKAAFWLGERVASEYIPAICEAVRPEPCLPVYVPNRPN